MCGRILPRCANCDFEEENAIEEITNIWRELEFDKLENGNIRDLLNLTRSCWLVVMIPIVIWTKYIWRSWNSCRRKRQSMSERIRFQGIRRHISSSRSHEAEEDGSWISPGSKPSNLPHVDNALCALQHTLKHGDLEKDRAVQSTMLKYSGRP
jgi:hypothetical protein